MRRFSPGDLSGEPCYLLEILWNGRTYRFASRVVELSSSDGSVYRYEPLLEEPAFSEQSDRNGFSDSGPSIPIGIDFGIDIAAEAAAGRPLDSATGLLAVVFLDQASRASLQSYEERFILARGEVSLPVYADPEDVAGYATFTLEQPVSDDPSTLIPPGSVISSLTWPSAPAASLGKVYPFVFGSPGSYTDAGGTAQTVPATPAYLVATNKLLVAGHACKGDTVTVYDEDGTTYSATLAEERDLSGNGRIVTTADISGAGGSFNKTGKTFHVAWPTTGGGLVDPLTGEVLERLGDVCVWALSRGRDTVDTNVWEAYRPLLRSVVLAGYSNNAEQTIYEFLRDEVFELIPFEVRAGPRGIYPLLHRALHRREDALVSIVEGADFEPVSPVTTQTEQSELRNEHSLRFAVDDMEDSYQRSLLLTAGVDTSDADRRNSPTADRSQARYGRRAESLTSDFIYSTVSAGAVLQMRCRASALPTLTRSYLADAAYGWPHVGDVILLTSSSLHFTEKLMEVSRKQWTGLAWLLEVSWTA